MINEQFWLAVTGFYNDYGGAIVASAVDAIASLVGEYANVAVDRTTGQKIANILGDAFVESADFGIDTEATTRAILAEIGASCCFEPNGELAAAVLIQVLRTKINMIEGIRDLYRSVLVEAGVAPNDPRLRG